MKLFFSPTSPYVRKVMVLLHESGQLQDVTLESVASTPVAPAQGLDVVNPLTKVPALVTADGVALFDSRVICAYLDDRGGAGLYPQDAQRWRVLALEALADGILDAALAMTYEARLRPEAQRWPEWVEGQWGKIMRACQVLNKDWGPDLQQPLNMGQIALGCALGYVDFRHGARDWRRGNDALATWFAAFDSRPAMAKTAPPEG